MKYIKSLILLIVTIIAFSSATTYTLTGFTVKDLTQSCNFSIPANGSCTSNSKCGTTPAAFSYSIVATKDATSSNNYTISGFSNSTCTPIANNAFVNSFLCIPNTPVTVKVSTNNVNVTCVEKEENSSSKTVLSLTVLIVSLFLTLL